MADKVVRKTGHPAIDRVLREYVGAVEAAFPNRVRAIYLSGSYAENRAVPVSDVGGLVVFRGETTPEESASFAKLTRAFSVSHGILVDFGVRGEADLFREGELPAKAASRVLVFGQDICEHVPAMPLWGYIAQVMQGAWFYMSLVRSSAPLRAPLTYPDPDGAFFGYERNGLRSYSGWDQPGTKALVGGMTLASTTLVAIHAGLGVVHASASVEAYRATFHDSWAEWLSDLYVSCKHQWAYQVPPSESHRRHLRGLCEHALGFENHFHHTCRNYLAAEIKQPDPSRCRSADHCLRQISDYSPQG